MFHPGENTTELFALQFIVEANFLFRKKPGEGSAQAEDVYFIDCLIENEWDDFIL